MRSRLSISLHPEDLNRLENLQKNLDEKDILFMPSTSFVLRLALAVLEKTPNEKVKEVADKMPYYKTGRPKQQKI
ncbi:hypothetical protein NIES4101_27590 (plasmid) [Calothrix sp. NIES-4101]|nr:hypothetical protein NIES4101_27590 [Calothrix sp. NIES-4101]